MEYETGNVCFAISALAVTCRSRYPIAYHHPATISKPLSQTSRPPLAIGVTGKCRWKWIKLQIPQQWAQWCNCSSWFAAHKRLQGTGGRLVRFDKLRRCAAVAVVAVVVVEDDEVDDSNSLCSAPLFPVSIYRWSVLFLLQCDAVGGWHVA